MAQKEQWPSPGRIVLITHPSTPKPRPAIIVEVVGTQPAAWVDLQAFPNTGEAGSYMRVPQDGYVLREGETNDFGWTWGWPPYVGPAAEGTPPVASKGQYERELDKPNHVPGEFVADDPA